MYTRNFILYQIWQ